MGIRISADEFLPGGLDVTAMLEVVGLLKDEFPLAFIHVSHSAYAGSFSLATQMADMSFPPAPFRHFPAAFKAAFPDLPAAADVVAGDWDAVVVATGSAPAVTPVPDCRTLSPHEALALAEVGTSVAVVDERGDWTGAGLAEHLAAGSQKIYLVTPTARLAWNITTYSRLGLIDRLGRLGVRVCPLRRPVRGEPGGLVIADTLTGDESLLPDVTAVVHAGPPTANDGLFRELELIAGAPAAVLVGDAYAPRSALEAVFEAKLATSRLLTGDTVLAAGGAGA